MGLKDTTGLGKRAWFFGYKLHLAVDADTELPISVFVTTAKESDTRSLLPLLDRAAQTLAIHPAYVLAGMLTGPVWWFYLFWVPDFLNKKYGLDLIHLGLPLATIERVGQLDQVRWCRQGLRLDLLPTV